MSSTKKINELLDDMTAIKKTSSKQYFPMGSETQKSSYFEDFAESEYVYKMDFNRVSEYFESLWKDKDPELLELAPKLDTLVEKRPISTQSQDVSEFVYAMF